MIMGLQTSGIVAIDPLGRMVLPADSWLAGQGASSSTPPFPCSHLSTQLGHPVQRQSGSADLEKQRT
jgi:hypothetical protein